MSEVKVAENEDVDDLVSLNRDVQSLHAALYPNDFRPHADPAALRHLLVNVIADKMHKVGVHPGPTGAKGYVWIELQDRPETALTPASRQIYIHHIAVSCEYRRKGVASSLMRWVDEYAALMGIDQILLDHWVANDSAHAFFASIGYSPLRIVMRKNLRDVC